MKHAMISFDIPEGDRTVVDQFRAHLHEDGWKQLIAGRPKEASACWSREFEDTMKQEQMWDEIQAQAEHYGLDTPMAVAFSDSPHMSFGKSQPYEPSQNPGVNAP